MPRKWLRRIFFIIYSGFVSEPEKQKIAVDAVVGSLV